MPLFEKFAWLGRLSPIGPANEPGSTGLTATNLNNLEDRIEAGIDAAAAASQPLSGDLSAIDALTTAAYGRGLLEAANAAAARAALGVAPTWQIGTHAARLAIASPETGAAFTESDRHITYRYNGAAWVPVSTGWVRKSADETVNNSNTYQDDDHLNFPIEANEAFAVEALLIVEGASAAADIRASLRMPAGGTGYMQSNAQMSVGTGTTPNALTAANPSAGAAGAIFGSLFTGWAINGATAGTAYLQWAMNTATAEDLKLKTNSMLRLTPLA